jgi:serine/threonine protein kinase
MASWGHLMARVIDGKWEIVKQLGEGGQAQAFIVRDVVTDGRAVLKRLKNPSRLPRFEQEISILKSIDHPRVLRLIDANSAAEKPYLVSEYCELGSLEDQKEAVSKLSLGERLALFGQIVDGVTVAHQAGIVHRDLKPSNIFVRALDDVVVGDFGICFIQTPERLTETLEAVGARYYMAPELADGRIAEVKPAADVYSLGKVLYWLLAGRIFDRENHRKTDRLLTNLYPFEWTLQIHQFLDALIEYDMAERLPDARAVAVAFKDLQRRVTAGYPTLEHPPQICRYCGVGKYKLLGNSEDSAAVFKFGLQPANTPLPHVFVCVWCGNVIMFRPQYSKNPNWLGA